MQKPTITSSCITILLTVVFFVALLFGVNAVTVSRIAAFEKAHKDLAAQQALSKEIFQSLFPEATGFTKLGATAFHDSSSYYYRVDKGSTVIGYAIHAFGKGYQSVIHAVVGVNPDFTIRAVKVINQAETEGLGSRMVEDDFLKQFIGKNPHRMHVITEGDTTQAIMAITGATISSRGFTEDAVKTAVIFLEKRLNSTIGKIP